MNNERYRRAAIRAQQAAASAYAWMRGRCDWPNAPRHDLLCDQAYVAKRYEQARAAAVEFENVNKEPS